MSRAMQNIKTLNGNEGQIGNLGHISVRKRDRHEAGYCNACTDHDHTIIYEIQLRSVSVRVCPKCRELLLKELVTFK